MYNAHAILQAQTRFYQAVKDGSFRAWLGRLDTCQTLAHICYRLKDIAAPCNPTLPCRMPGLKNAELLGKVQPIMKWKDGLTS